MQMLEGAVRYKSNASDFQIPSNLMSSTGRQMKVPCHVERNGAHFYHGDHRSS